MARKSLVEAAEEVNSAREATSDPDVGDRLDALSDQLRAQADRDAPPALGVLDRIHVKLREIEQQTDEATVTESIERARQELLTFLGTLDDRGMKQH